MTTPANNKPLVLITGATGHLGFRTAVLALQAGYRTRLAIRKPAQADKLRAAPSLQPHLDAVSFVTVPDITSPTAYDTAIRDVTHILHIASPIPTAPQPQHGTWQAHYSDPAIKGTLSMLTAASQTPSVETVVITSSVVVLEPRTADGRAGPSDLKPIPDAAATAAVADPWRAYAVSKILAHAAATDFLPRAHFKLVRVLPGYIQGAHELLEREDEFFSGSNEGTINAVSGNLVPGPKVTAQVALDDAARAHVAVLGNERVGSGDVLVVVGNDGVGVPWDEVAAVAGRLFPKAVEKGALRLVQGQESAVSRFDVAGSEEALGFRFAGPEEMVRGVVRQYLEMKGEVAE